MKKALDPGTKKAPWSQRLRGAVGRPEDRCGVAAYPGGILCLKRLRTFSVRPPT